MDQKVKKMIKQKDKKYQMMESERGEMGQGVIKEPIDIRQRLGHSIT